MNNGRKKPGVAFWAAIVVACVLAYPLSLGPACWLTSRIETGASVVTLFHRITLAMSAVRVYRFV